ncbi:DUF7149 domain-containing protein [Salegentibacter tibetensis]
MHHIIINSNFNIILEAKKPNNRADMLSKENINVKAFQELVLYYLRERITHKNLEVKYCSIILELQGLIKSTDENRPVDL